MELTRELQENSGLRWVLDQLAPLSPFGRAAARAPRWYGPGQEAALERELDNVALALGLLDARDDGALRGVTRCLPQFHDIRGSFDRDPASPFDLVELFEIKHFLVLLEQVLQAYAALPPFAGLAFAPVDGALALVDPEGRRLPAFSLGNSCHEGLGPLRAEKAALEKAIRTAGEDEKPALLEQRRVLAVDEDRLELEVRLELTRKLMAFRGDFLANMDALGRLDLLLAKAKLARQFGCVRPVLSPDGTVSLAGLRHPQVAAELERRDEQFTPLDLELSQGCTVITGANMGGKTVSLRAVVLSLLLFQCGYFVFARSARLPMFQNVALILADTGPGSGGLSSFGREVHLLDQLLRRAGEGRFFLALDEFARGTNPQEGAALARALVRYLGGLDCAALLTTHYDGVSDAAGAQYQVAGLVRDLEGDEGDDPRRRIARRMDYRLISTPPGAPCPRDALRVCRLLSLAPELTQLLETDLE
ncbi:MAG: DNA mismatch repair protein MutS [Oscillospiraceae bacterium]|nr:DNA mismatch repair protein MutS [Oscillospiraceae bacterium]